jgi:hypothetical protein
MTPAPARDSSALGRTLDRIRELSPKYAARLDKQLARMNGQYFARAERFIAAFEEFLNARDKHLCYGVDCHLKLRECMLQDRMDFLRSGRYASSSFAEVKARVYANPEVMEYYMYGLVFSQFFWPEQYARLEFFCNDLPRYRDVIRSYVEIGGGHSIYVSCALDLLRPETLFEVVDISPTSIDVSRAMCPNERIQYHLCDVFDFPEDRMYDFVVAGEILEHLEQPHTLLRRIRRMLTPRGRAFISTPVNAPTVDHIYLFNSAQEIRDMLAAERFVIESEATRWAEDVTDAQAGKLKVAQMFAAFVRAE